MPWSKTGNIEGPQATHESTVHDDRYFTEAEADARFATSGHTHSTTPSSHRARQYLAGDGTWRYVPTLGQWFLWEPSAVLFAQAISGNHASDFSQVTNLYVSDRNASNGYSYLWSVANQFGQAGNRGIVALSPGHNIDGASGGKATAIFRVSGDVVTVTGGWQVPVTYLGGTGTTINYTSNQTLSVEFFPATKVTPADIGAVTQTTSAVLNASGTTFTGTARYSRTGNLVTVIAEISRASGSSTGFTNIPGVTAPAGFLPAVAAGSGINFAASIQFNGTVTYRFRILSTGELDVQQSGALTQVMALSASYVGA